MSNLGARPDREDTTAASGRLGFMVFGSARSGTTLVQRLLCEIPGVRMPAETHFFSEFASGLLTHRRFPLEGAELSEELARFAGLETSRGLDVDVEAVMSDLDGHCAGAFAMFDAIVRQVSGPAVAWGEKTPDHLMWWRPIARAAPWLRFVAVVRDPRSVVASTLTMPWRDDPRVPGWGEDVHLAFAARWSHSQRQVTAMLDELGHARCTFVRYEDLVADPGPVRSRLAEFLGLDASTKLQSPSSRIVAEWEPWKQRALGPVTAERVATWKDTLDPRKARQVQAVCRSGMRQFGYTGDLPGTLKATAARLGLGPRAVVRLTMYARAYKGYQLAIDRRTV